MYAGKDSSTLPCRLSFEKDKLWKKDPTPSTFLRRRKNKFRSTQNKRCCQCRIEQSRSLEGLRRCPAWGPLNLRYTFVKRQRTVDGLFVFLPGQPHRLPAHAAIGGDVNTGIPVRIRRGAGPFYICCSYVNPFRLWSRLFCGGKARDIPCYLLRVQF